MKRITALLVAVVMAFGSVGIADTAQANNIDIKARGTWDFSFGIMDNSHFGKSYNDTSQRGGRGRIGADDARRRGAYKNFEALQRIRTQINFISGEHLQGVLQFEMGIQNWGRGGADGQHNAGNQQGGQLDSRGINIKTRLAYLDWIVPHTQVSVRMGIQRLNLPSNRFGNPVFSDCVAGIVVSSPITDNFALTGFWVRPFADNRVAINDSGQRLRNDTDVFGLIAPVTLSGVSFSPYVMYAHIGNGGTGADGQRWGSPPGSPPQGDGPGFGRGNGFWNYTFVDIDNSTRANSSTNAWWLGANLNVDILDPLVFTLDAIYGGINKTRHSALRHPDLAGGPDVDGRISASGWYIGSTLDYKLSWGTPGIFGWYSSGDRKNAVKALQDGDGNYIGDPFVERVRVGRLPVLGTNGGFGPTSFGTAGFWGIGNGNGLNDPVISNTGTGTWGIGIQLADVSFIEDLSHTLRFAYYQGTNSASNYHFPDGTIAAGGGEVRSALMYDADYMYLTTKDSVFEVNFDHVYKIYENLEVCLELGWLRLNSNRNTWGSERGDRLKKNDDAWKATINFKYSF